MSRLPWRLQLLIARATQWARDRREAGRDPEAVFTQIYEDRVWDPGRSSPFCSGLGSHDPSIVTTYISAVQNFLRSIGAKPDVVDLGCGDFNVGRQIRGDCGRYVACDVVRPLVEHNRLEFSSLEVDFRHVDLAEDELPDGRVAFIRQVLQHLSNDQIAKVVLKLARYEYVVLTEHLPGVDSFRPNVDKPPGHGIRVGRLPPSGVVLTAPPFDLRPLETTCIAVMPYEGGRVQTLVYRMR